MSRESGIRTLCTAMVAAGCTLLLPAQTMADDNRENIIVQRDVPPHIPYRGHPVGKATSIDPSPDELLLSIMGLDKGDRLGETTAMSDADIDGQRATPGQLGASAGNGGPGFTEFLIGNNNSKGSLQSQSLAGRLGGGVSNVGRTTTAATRDLDVRINSALQPLSGLVNIR